jgi:hypothetical protein
MLPMKGGESSEISRDGVGKFYFSMISRAIDVSLKRSRYIKRCPPIPRGASNFHSLIRVVELNVMTYRLNSKYDEMNYVRISSQLNHVCSRLL